MTGCPEREMALQALADGELDAMGIVALEEHLRGCAGCRGALDRLEALRAVLRDPALRTPAPEQLRARVMAQLPRPAPARPWVAWAGGAVGGALAASLALMLAMPQAAAPVADELVDSHIRSLQGTHLIDVQTSDRHVVKPWFNGRVDFAPAVPELKDQGFPLVGGRLDVVSGRSVAVIVYKRRLHTINLFVRPATGAAGGSERRGSYGLVHWVAGGLDYTAVSDLELGDLEQFRAAFAKASGG